MRERALHVAAAHGKVEIVSILLAHAYGPIFRPSGMKVSFRNIFNYANMIDPQLPYRLWLDSTNPQHCIVQEISKALFPAVMSGNVDVVRALLDDSRALHDVCMHLSPSGPFSSPLYLALTQKHEAIIQLFLTSNTYDINKPIVHSILNGWQLAIQVATETNTIRLLADAHVQAMIERSFYDDDSKYLVEQLFEKRLVLFAALQSYLNDAPNKVEVLEKILKPEHVLYKVFSYKSTLEMFSFVCTPETNFIAQLQSMLAEEKANRLASKTFSSSESMETRF